MKIFPCLCLLLLFSGCSTTEKEVRGPEFRDLFNGKDLTGWEGDPEIWSVGNGVITGTTSEEDPLPYNKFLIWSGGILRDFELVMEIRVEGDNNSGIQYRSQHRTDLGDFVVSGYQADIHPRTEYNAMLYEEKGRGIIAQHGQKVVIDENGDKWLIGSTGPLTETSLEEWNEYQIIGRGNYLVHKLNGNITIEVIDHQVSARSLEGILAIQVHQGPVMRVQVKNIRLKELPEQEMVDPADTPIPPGSVKLP